MCAMQYNIMEPKKANKEVLAKGVRYMAIAFLCMFISPVVIHSAFKNQDHTLYVPILLLGFLGATFAVYMGFKGIKTIMKSLFGDK